VAHSGGRVVLECQIDPVGSSLQRDDIVIATVRRKEQRYSSYHHASLPLGGFRSLRWTPFTPSNLP
jgi:hypothetical protein